MAQAFWAQQKRERWCVPDTVWRCWGPVGSRLSLTAEWFSEWACVWLHSVPSFSPEQFCEKPGKVLPYKSRRHGTRAGSIRDWPARSCISNWNEGCSTACTELPPTNRSDSLLSTASSLRRSVAYFFLRKSFSIVSLTNFFSSASTSEMSSCLRSFLLSNRLSALSMSSFFHFQT